ncbi:polysaccharide pyruvyl transferase family protein [Pseudomonas spirodelae]|uniref:Polysaccharide pyruvyl transferase family protein n=1 Tax=Pseudomonas spirodelae TaxID=3101751 RepID=A0ABU5P4W6_9PSED|nr:polysaccharide pyruvyl transferase family protein [Pseudomonas sp. T5W1]MEA1604720.1 polysaccharide pyruvyl transferase family protein [Pseudomonas sp. T5W1]
MNSNIEAFLKSFVGERVLFAPNPGNAGDSVIACAEYQMLDRLGIDYSVVPLDIDPSKTKGAVIFYGGGGNLVAPYPNARNFISRHHEHAKRLVILPHTIVGYSELVSALGSNVDIICREQVSYDYVSQFVTCAKVHLMDDVALSLDVSALLTSAGISESAWLNRPLRTAKRFVRVLLHRFKNASQRNTLNSFRGDVEGTGRADALANFDVSQMLAADSMSALDSVIAARSFIGFVSQFDVVRTDRLHVCIVSLLLNKEVHFFDNSYGKNRAVYEFSMAGRYPNISWCD